MSRSSQEVRCPRRPTRGPPDALERRHLNRRLGRAFAWVQTLRGLFLCFALIELALLFFLSPLIALNVAIEPYKIVLIALVGLDVLLNLSIAWRLGRELLLWTWIAVGYQTLMTALSWCGVPIVALGAFFDYFWLCFMWALVPLATSIHRLMLRYPDMRIVQRIRGTRRSAPLSSV